MQCSGEQIGVTTWVVTETPLPNRIRQIQTAQVVADHGDTLTVVAQGSNSPITVNRDEVKSYQSVYGTSIPGPNDRPVVKL